MVNRAAAVEGGKNATGELLGVDSNLVWGGGGWFVETLR
jgi:hypothetical protein